MEMIVYTAIFGEYDELRQPIVHQSAKMFCVTDKEVDSGLWNVIGLAFDESPCRRARWAKTHSHELFEDDVTVWVDGSVCLKVDIGKIAKELLGDADIAMFAHPTRRCAYEEAKACIRFGKDDKDMIESQMSGYRKIGFPENYGLVASGIVIRRNCRQVVELNECWWGEICRGSKRDQLSFDFCRWETGVRFKHIPGSIYDGSMCELDRYHSRGRK